MTTIKETSTRELKDILFFEGFIKYTNELYRKTGKKIRSIGNLSKAYEAYKIMDFNGKRSYNSLKEYPTAKEVAIYVVS